MSETPLLDWIAPYQSHSPTSRAAAEEIKIHIGPMHARILGYLLVWNGKGGTDEEMQVGLKLPGSSQRPRRRELQQAGLIADSGKTRATKSGRQAVVWVLAPAPPSHPDERIEGAT